MDFFEHQDAARRRTGILVVYFGLAVVAIIAAVYGAVLLVFAGVAAKTGGAGPAFWRPEILGPVVVVTVLVVLSGSVYKILQLSDGGESVARMLGGRRVNPGTQDADERKLLNVVEEMAIAAGIPVPKVFVLADEESINAFAAGFSPMDAAIGVTRGCMTILSRDELQGVIAHEFSHILNGDMRLNIRLIGVIHGIMVISMVGYIIMRMTLYSGRGHSRSRRSGKGGGGVLGILAFGLLLMAIGYIGMLFGRLIQSAVSRQREYLADASAVQFTRNPDSIAGALKKIGGLVDGSQVCSAHAREASHLFFGDALQASFLNVFATHPPLVERIRRLDRGFDGAFERVVSAGAQARPTPLRDQYSGVGASGLHGGGGQRAAVNPEALMASVGTVGARHIGYAKSIAGAIPAAARTATQDPFGAQAAVLSLLLDRDAAVSKTQMSVLEETLTPGELRQVVTLAPAIRDLDPRCRLPLLDLALPALQEFSQGQYRRFHEMIRRLVEADAEISLFEYALQRIVLSRLGRKFDQPDQLATIKTEAAIHQECLVILSALAYVGGGDQTAAVRAFNTAAMRIGTQVAVAGILPADQCSLTDVDEALKKLALTTLFLKRKVMNACIACVTADRQITVEEGELVRLVAASIDCPMPPILMPE